jgi:hypothetical protein
VNEVELYVIWSINKAGWVSRAANYTSDVAEAKQFHSRKDAVEMCAKHSYNRAIDWMPVRLDDLTLVRATIK